jgi:hypothetical protein
MTTRSPQARRCACYALRVLQHADFEGDWLGWRLRGRWLISPHGDRVSVRRLAGLVWLHCKAARQGGPCDVVNLAPGRVQTAEKRRAIHGPFTAGLRPAP